MNLPAAENKEFALTDDLLNGFKAKYPQIDVQGEIYKLHLWLHKNQARRPKLMLRFIDKWLSRTKPKETKLHLIGGKLSEHELLALGRKNGMEPRAGENWTDFSRRVFKQLNEMPRG